MITLYGFLQIKPTLLSDNLILPSEIDQDMLIDYIVRKTGDLYPYHQQPERLAYNINTWSRANAHNFEMMYKAMYADYVPNENYDRIETGTNKLKHTGTDQAKTDYDSGTTQAHTGNDSNVGTGTITDERSVSAFDATGYSPAEKNVRSPHDTVTSNYNSNMRTTADGSDTLSNIYDSAQNTEYESRVHGNIGVTTNAKMITEEMELRASFDLYNAITRLFEREFLIEVY